MPLFLASVISDPPIPPHPTHLYHLFDQSCTQNHLFCVQKVDLCTTYTTYSVWFSHTEPPILCAWLIKVLCAWLINKSINLPHRIGGIGGWEQAIRPVITGLKSLRFLRLSCRIDHHLYVISSDFVPAVAVKHKELTSGIPLWCTENHHALKAFNLQSLTWNSHFNSKVCGSKEGESSYQQLNALRLIFGPSQGLFSLLNLLNLQGLRPDPD